MFGIIWATRQEIQKDYQISARTMDHRLEEFQKYIDQGRYSKYCIQKCIGYTRIDYVAFMDFMKYRDWLNDRHLCKVVKPFNRADVIREMQMQIPEQQSAAM